MHPSPSNALMHWMASRYWLPFLPNSKQCTFIKDSWPVTTGCVDMCTFICISWSCAAASDNVLRPTPNIPKLLHCPSCAVSTSFNSQPFCSAAVTAKSVRERKRFPLPGAAAPGVRNASNTAIWFTTPPGQVTPRLCVGQFFLQFVHSCALSGAWQPLQRHDASLAASLTGWVCVAPEAPAPETAIPPKQGQSEQPLEGPSPNAAMISSATLSASGDTIGQKHLAHANLVAKELLHP